MLGMTGECCTMWVCIVTKNECFIVIANKNNVCHSEQSEGSCLRFLAMLEMTHIKGL